MQTSVVLSCCRADKRFLSNTVFKGSRNLTMAFKLTPVRMQQS